MCSCRSIISSRAATKWRSSPPRRSMCSRSGLTSSRRQRPATRFRPFCAASAARRVKRATSYSVLSWRGTTFSVRRLCWTNSCASTDTPCATISSLPSPTSASFPMNVTSIASREKAARTVGGAIFRLSARSRPTRVVSSTTSTTLISSRTSIASRRWWSTRRRLRNVSLLLAAARFQATTSWGISRRKTNWKSTSAVVPRP